MKKSFPFYYENYIAGTALLNRREKGAYVDLLCYQADKTDKGKGHLTFQDIRDILNSDFDIWEKLKSKFVEEDGFYYNKKLESVKRGKKKKTEEEIAIDRAKLDQLINEKKLKFYNDCKPFLAKYPKEMLRRFYNYWSETNKTQTKLRFEFQPTFEISKRLATWARKDKEIIKTEPDNISYKELVERFNKGETAIWEKYEPVTPGDKRTMWKKKNNL